MKTNNKPVIFSSITIVCSLVLMNLVNLSDKVPEAFVNVFGIISLIATALCIFFSVRSACALKEENEGKE